MGQVNCVDNGKQPTEEFCACQLEAGQNVYANTEDPEHIYVEYDNGCAVFTLKDEHNETVPMIRISLLGI